MPGAPIKRARRGGIRLADGTVHRAPKLTHPRAGLYGETRPATVSGLEKLGRPRKPQPIFQESQPADAGTVTVLEGTWGKRSRAHANLE
jgi:hypothetical protein